MKNVSACGSASTKGRTLWGFSFSKLLVWSSMRVNSSLVVFSCLLIGCATDGKSLTNIRYKLHNQRNDRSWFLVLGADICCTASILFVQRIVLLD